MAIDALDFDRCSDFTVELGIPVAVLIKVAIDTVHPFFGVDIHQVNGHSITLLAVNFFKLIGRLHRSHERGSRRILDLFAFVVEQIAFAILFEHSAEDPTVAMEVCKLRVLQEWIEFADAG